MTPYLEVIAQEWIARAEELAQWAYTNMVNRTDVWGSYISKDRRRENLFFTAPFPAARGKVFLTKSTLTKHFTGIDEGNLISLHSTSADKTSRWLGIDIDKHDVEDAATPEGNLAAALAWYNKLLDQNFDPLLLDSNGAGGYHLLIIFSEPVPTADIFAFGQQLISDYEKRGLARQPETYPKQVCMEEGHVGNCLRLLGRHHTREHFSRVWSDDSGMQDPWLEGASAIDRILNTRLASPSLLPRNIPLPEKKKVTPQATKKDRPRVCVDLDGVLAQYDGWKGLDFTGDPIPGAVEFTRRLAEFAEIVIYTTRCTVEPHRDELHEPTRPASDLAPRLMHNVKYWLDKHKITYHEIFIGQGKPIASAYIDDRAVRCSPQLDKSAYAESLMQAKMLCDRRSTHTAPGDSRLQQLSDAWENLPETTRDEIVKKLQKPAKKKSSPHTK